MQLSKIVTRRGDDGMTDLAGGGRVPKSSLRVEAYGTVDELNAVVGMLRTKLLQGPHAKLDESILPRLQKVQDMLFDVGSDLASFPNAEHRRPDCVEEAEVNKLEEELEATNASLPTLKSFVLPGGGELNAWAHMARTVCRRAERSCHRLSMEEEVHPMAMRFLNRLSDYFFVLSRHFAALTGEEEFLWQRPLS
jgi:cob(I)alamin adenosyltransferase